MYKNVHMRLVDVVSMPAKKRSIMPFKTVKYPEDKRYLFFVCLTKMRITFLTLDINVRIQIANKWIQTADLFWSEATALPTAQLLVFTSLL